MLLQVGRFIEIEQLKPASVIGWQLASGLPLPTPAFPGQDLAPLMRGMRMASLGQGPGSVVAPPVELQLFTIDNGWFFVAHGLDGAILTADRRPIRKTAAFCRLNKERGLEGAALDLPEPVELDEVFVGFDGAWRNYFHWMCFAVTKSFLAARHLDASVVIAVPDYVRALDDGGISHSEAAWRQSLAFSGVASRLTALPSGAYRARKLHFFWTTPREPTDIMYCTEFKDAFDVMARHAAPASESPENVYLARSPWVAPRLSPEVEVMLAALLPSRGFTTVRFEGADLATQISVIANAKRVVSPHGAGLANLLFHRGGLKVLELNSDLDGAGMFRPWFYVVSALRKHRYVTLDVTAPDLGPQQVEAALAALDG
jgi:hypothetical protein